MSLVICVLPTHQLLFGSKISFAQEFASISYGSITFLYIPIILESRTLTTNTKCKIRLQNAMTGEDLRQLLLNKWGRSYDVQLRRTQGKIFVQIMWKYLEQVSFPLSETEYIQHLDSITNYLEGLGAIAQVDLYIQQTREKPRLGKAVSIPVDLGERASEWLVQ